jgi:LysM repeat protein
MAAIEVKDNQSLADIAVQYLGDSSAAKDIAQLNGISISTTLVKGQVLQLPDTINNKKIANYYAKRGLVPASVATERDAAVVQGGIDYMSIGVDFIVS